MVHQLSVNYFVFIWLIHWLFHLHANLDVAVIFVTLNFLLVAQCQNHFTRWLWLCLRVFIHSLICVRLCGPAGGERAHQGGEGGGQVPQIQLSHQVHEHDGPQSRLLHWLVFVSCGETGTDGNAQPQSWEECELGDQSEPALYLFSNPQIQLRLCSVAKESSHFFVTLMFPLLICSSTASTQYL